MKLGKDVLGGHIQLSEDRYDNFSPLELLSDAQSQLRKYEKDNEVTIIQLLKARERLVGRFRGSTTVMKFKDVNKTTKKGKYKELHLVLYKNGDYYDVYAEWRGKSHTFRG